MVGNRVMVVAGTVLAVLLVGCDAGTPQAEDPPVPSISGAADDSSSAPPPAPPPVAGPSSQVPPTTAPPSSPAAPRPAPDPRECQVDELRVTLAGGEGAAGTVYRELRFTNTGGRTCVLQGFPGVSYVAGADGHQVGPAAFREGRKGPPVPLAPGQAASAPVGFVQVRNYDPAVCQPTEVRGLRVYPPHEYDSVFVPAPGTGCAGTPPGNQLTVQTVRR